MHPSLKPIFDLETSTVEDIGKQGSKDGKDGKDGKDDSCLWPWQHPDTK